ncbi:hypothetical protein VNO78_18119 [Psophocarpus tetragonolobus]|uniref:Uncharacterized protein n=1 Tax=Psophocarpus tetragonolobus TaxID=3891 RepID=A0AAN9XLW4_PSOTE
MEFRSKCTFPNHMQCSRSPVTNPPCPRLFGASGTVSYHKLDNQHSSKTWPYLIKIDISTWSVAIIKVCCLFSKE